MDASEPQRPLIVGVGASVGGLEALMQLLEPVELPLGAAIIVIQHLAPDYRSLMVELLGQHTRLAVVPAVDQAQIEPDTVYVIHASHFGACHAHGALGGRARGAPQPATDRCSV